MVNPPLPSFSVRYTVSGAAFLLQTHPATVRRWANGYTTVNAAGQRVHQAAILSDRDDPTLLNYFELVELLFVKELTRPRGDGLKPLATIKEVREIVDFLVPKLGRYPLTSAKLQTIGKQIITSKLEEPHYTNVAIMQHLFDFAEELQPKFVYIDDVVTTWYPTGDSSIQVDPRFCFGQPIVRSRVSVHSIYQRYLIEDRDIEETRDWFSIPEDEVLAAVRFEEEWASPQAA